MTIETSPPRPFGLRAHQAEAVAAAATAFTTHRRGQVLMPCGTGKTAVGIGVARALSAELCLVVVPTLDLIRQASRTWQAQLGRPVAVLFACSDTTLKRGGHDSPDSTASVSHSPDATVVSTDARVLAGLLAARTHDGVRVRLAFSTYASLPVALEAARAAGMSYDLVVADEAHHCVGPAASARTALARPSQTDVVTNRVLFMTATPRRSQGDSQPPGVVCMDDERAFGPVFYELPLRAAIAAGLLSDYRVAVVGTTPGQWERMTRASARRGGLAAPEVVAREGLRVVGRVDSSLLAATFALGRAMSEYSLRRVLTFHNRIEDAQLYADVAPKLLRRLRWQGMPEEVSAAAAFSGMSSRARSEVLRRFAEADGRHAVIATNVRCLTEGVDVPALDAVMFASPRKGHIDLAQAVGRVMRPHPAKERGTVVLPVLADPRRSALATSTFADTVHVLMALREHDSELAAQIDHLRREVGYGRRLRVADLFHGTSVRVTLPRGLPDDFVHAFQLRLVSAASSSWWERYGVVQRWAAEAGHANVPVSARLSGVRVGSWVHEQRSLRRRGLLPGPRSRALEELPGWVWSSWDAAWEQAFRLLLAYVHTHGTSRVPQLHRVDDFGLGAWVKAQRELQSKKKLPPHRAARLEELPGWYWRSPARPRARVRRKEPVT